MHAGQMHRATFIDRVNSRSCGFDKTDALWTNLPSRMSAEYSSSWARNDYARGWNESTYALRKFGFALNVASVNEIHAWWAGFMESLQLFTKYANGRSVFSLWWNNHTVNLQIRCDAKKMTTHGYLAMDIYNNILSSFWFVWFFKGDLHNENTDAL